MSRPTLLRLTVPRIEAACASAYVQKPKTPNTVPIAYRLQSPIVYLIVLSSLWKQNQKPSSPTHTSDRRDRETSALQLVGQEDIRMCVHTPTHSPLLFPFKGRVSCRVSPKDTIERMPGY